MTLSDDEAKRRRGQKTVIERMAPPTFDVAVEIIDRHCWRVHQDVAQAVDALLRGALSLTKGFLAFVYADQFLMPLIALWLCESP